MHTVDRINFSVASDVFEGKATLEHLSFAFSSLRFPVLEEIS